MIYDMDERDSLNRNMQTLLNVSNKSTLVSAKVNE
jgi:hypothetical protein